MLRANASAMKASTKARRTAIWISIASLLFIFSLFACRFELLGAKTKEQAFEKFFSSRPASVEVIAYGQDRTMLGDGSYALVFKMPEAELREFLTQQGYKPAGIETGSGHWRLDMINSIIKRLVTVNVQIEPSFICYSKVAGRTSARVFYDTNQQSAVFVGFGRYPR